MLPVNKTQYNLFSNQQKIIDSNNLRGLFVRAVLKIDPDQRKAVIKHSFNIMELQINPNIGEHFFDKINMMFENDQEACLSIQNFIPDVYFSTCINMINTVSLIPNDQRDEIIVLANSFFNGNTYLFDKSRIISAIHKIPIEQRNTCIRTILQFINNNTNSSDKAALIEMIASLDDSERIAIVNSATKFFTADMNTQEKITLIKALKNIRSSDRDGVVQHVLRIYKNLGSTIQPETIAARINELVNIDADQRAEYVQEYMEKIEDAKSIQQMNSTAQRIFNAIELIRKVQGDISEFIIDQAFQEFIQYLNNSHIDPIQKALARHVLLEPRAEDENFGPFIDQECLDIIILQIRIPAKELIARTWIFASQLPMPEDANAKNGMIYSLRDSYEEGSRVCNFGKVYRLLVSVFQGRLAGVDIDRIEEEYAGENFAKQKHMCVNKAILMFFNVKSYQELIEWQPLMDAAQRFCNENPNVNRDDFFRQIENYADLSGIERSYN